MEKSTAFVGLDVHKESIEIGIAEGGEVRHYGRCGGDAAAVDRLVHSCRSGIAAWSSSTRPGPAVSGFIGA